MKCNCLIIAGGVGARTGQDIPKQFLNVQDRPIIIYTLEAFQKHPGIDGITVVCVDGWQDILAAYAKQFGITKLESIVPGGANGQSSIRNGLYDIKERHGDPDDIVLIHDAIRPMVSQDIISDNIRVCREKGNAIAAIPCTAAMLVTEDQISSDTQVPRDNLKVAQTPQAYFVDDIVSMHKKALEVGITNSVASCTLYVELGRTLYLAQGSEKNLKITTAEDIEIFKALLNAHKEPWMH